MTGAAGDMIRVPLPALVDWTAAMLAGAGLGREDATLAAEMLVRTDARGYKTHGLARLKSYLEKLAAGEVAVNAAPKVEIEDALIRYDAGGALGQIAGPRAVAAAVDLARTRPVVACQLQDSGHLGALGLNLLGAADAGMVALMFQATPPIMGAPGATAALIGNNPLAMAAPRPSGPPIVVDMACCVAARGNILLAARDGTPIPEGWALDAEGAPTTDPEAALLGSLLPFGGHKGLALAMIVEILAGSLAGATFRKTLNEGGAVRSGAGHLNALILVLNPDLMQGRDAYEAHVSAWTDHFTAEGGPAARIPGQRAHDDEREAARAGVPLLPAIARELSAAGEAAGLRFPAATNDPQSETDR